MKKMRLPGSMLPVLLLCMGGYYAQAQTQTRTLTGTVTSEGRPLSGVSVSQEGLDATAVSNSEGRWQLVVTQDRPILRFHHPDYEEEQVDTGGQTVLNVRMKRASSVSQIEEVVVNAGYYKVKDRERTGSISRVTAKDLENQPVTNVLSAVQGRMTGVNIVQSSGVPGGGYDIQIRGRNSLRTMLNSTMDGNTPLYIIDGVPVSEMNSQLSSSIFPNRNINPLNTINPENIESIEILKDADATAIYGSRGANGVVLITTKKASKGEISLQFNTSFGVSTTLNQLKMLDTDQYLDMRRQAYQNDGIATIPSGAYDLTVWDPKKYTDWRSALIGNESTLSNQNLTLSGGGKQTNWMIALGQQEQTTVFDDRFKFKQYTLHSQLSHESEDRKLHINLNNDITFQKNNVIRTDVTKQAYTLSPNAPSLYMEDGSLNWENNTFANPLAAYNSTYSNDTRQFRSNIHLKYRFLKDLYFTINGGVHYQTMEEWMLQPHTIYSPSSAAGQSSAYSRSSFSSHKKLGLLAEPQIGWDYKTDDHRINVLLGSTFQKENNTTGSLTGVGYESNIFIHNIGAAKTKTIGDHISSDYHYLALFSRIGYDYKRKYFLNLTGRRDGSSRFGPNNRFATFGSLGAAWIFSEEPFMQKLGLISFGKLRGSWGITGSDNIGNHQYQNTFTSSTMLYNGINGLLPSRLYNPDFSWEKTTKLEAALELGFLQNRLQLTLAYYRNRSTQQLIGYQLPITTGFTSVLANLDAEVENRGWELEINATPIKRENFQWQTGFNISLPVNELISFPGLEQSTYANTFVIGYSTSVAHLYQFEGIDPATGLFRFKDVNGDGKISAPDDTKTLKDIGVQFFGGWHNTFTYKRWNVTSLIQFVKQDSRNYNHIMPIPGSMNNQPHEVLNVWSPTHLDGIYMPYTSGSNGSKNALHSYFQNSDASVSDASYIRLKNISVGYTIPLNTKYIRDVKLYAQGQNLFTFTRYFGIDPEFIQIGYLPPIKSYSFGFQLHF